MITDGAERRRVIVDYARECGRLEVSDLADRLGVANETVRRDLTKLERSGLIRRTHGTVYPMDHAGYESTLDFRSSQLMPEKRRIAAAALGMMGEEETIYLDEGFTCLLVAERLAQSELRITVVTPSLPAAIVLAEQGNASVIMLGGELRRPTLGMIGHWVSETIPSLSIDVAILGSNGITMDRGLTTPNPAVSEIKTTVVAHSHRRIFVGDHTKFGVDTFSRFAEVKDFDDLITDRGLPLYQAQRYGDLGPRVHRV